MMQVKERHSKERTNVWTKLKEEKEHGEDPWTTQDPWNKNAHTSPHWARTRGKTVPRKEKGRDRKAGPQSSLSDKRIGGEQNEEGSKPPAAFEKIVQQEARKGIQALELKMNQQVQEQNERLKSLESLITENWKRDREQDGSKQREPSE